MRTIGFEGPFTTPYSWKGNWMTHEQIKTLKFQNNMIGEKSIILCLHVFLVTMYNLQNNVYKSPSLHGKDAQDIFLITWTMASRGRQNVGSYYLFSLSLYKKNINHCILTRSMQICCFLLVLVYSTVQCHFCSAICLQGWNGWTLKLNWIWIQFKVQLC